MTPGFYLLIIRRDGGSVIRKYANYGEMRKRLNVERFLEHRAVIEMTGTEIERLAMLLKNSAK